MPTTTGFSRSVFTAFSVALILLLGMHSPAALAAGPEFFPPNGQKDVCPDVVLRVTFTGPAVIGNTGTIQILDAADNRVVETINVSSPISNQSIGGLTNFNYYPVIAANNQAEIHSRDGALSYGKTYYIKIDPNTFNNFTGITDANAWRFTTRSAPPVAEAGKLTVAADGTGDFCTVQGAVDSLPDGNTTPTTIFIRKGIYNELIFFTNKHALTFQGEDRKQTIIAYANNNNFNPATGSYRRGLFRAKGCDDLVVTNLTLHNTTPQRGSQAEAIILNGSTKAKAIIKDVDLYSYQDTLQINGQAYINNCHIEGDVDFLWGTGPCFFENCQFKSLKSKAYYTQVRNKPTNHGYVFYHCTFDGAANVQDMFLSRIAPATYPASEVVLINCELSPAVGDVAWRLDAAKNQPADQPPADTSNLHFWEFNSHDADGKPVDTSKRLDVSKQLTQPADAKTIEDYSNPTFVLGNDWNPRKAIATTAPES